MKQFNLESWRSYDEAMADVKKALLAGELTVLPTDTLYGLCANALDAKAIERVFEAKRRDERPISIIVSDLVMMRNFAEVPDKLAELFQRILPGPFTVILKSKYNFSKRISPDGKVGIRIPHYIFTTTIVRQLGFPITATSANLSGGKSPFKFDDVPGEILEKTTVAVDGGPTLWKEGSTVIDFTKSPPEILRKGARCEFAENTIKDFDIGQGTHI